MSDFMYGSICVSDVPKELFKKADNGKVYLNISISRRKEVSQYGETHTVIASIPKDERKEGEKPLYIGGMKEFTPNPVVTPERVADMPAAEPDDLPF